MSEILPVLISYSKTANFTSPAIPVDGAERIAIAMTLSGGENRTGTLGAQVSVDGTNFADYNMLVSNVTNSISQNITRVASIARGVDGTDVAFFTEACWKAIKLVFTVAQYSHSLSPSTSPSGSLSPSLSPSTSPSVSTSPSGSLSPSKSPSVSPSVSLSPSLSPSVSPSVSLSPSLSPSVSPSVSKSPSFSPSLSGSLSPSFSPSASPSVSLSPSISPSLSPSLSNSASPSLSPSPSPGSAGGTFTLSALLSY